MGILTRFKDIMSANINALLDKAEDPEKMIDQLLRNLNEDLGKVKSETATIMANEKSAQRAVEECDASIKKMTDYATKAVQAGNDADAKKFLEEKAGYTNKLAGLQSTYEAAKQHADQMRTLHDKLVKDINELESRKDVIKGKIEVAKAQERINKMTSSVDSANNSIAAFEKYEDMANKALDKAQAEAELNSGTTGIKDLTEKYDNAGTNVDDELAALKASLGK